MVSCHHSVTYLGNVIEKFAIALKVNESTWCVNEGNFLVYLMYFILDYLTAPRAFIVCEDGLLSYE